MHFIKIRFNCWLSFIFVKLWVQHDQGGGIGLAFKFVDGFFLVIWVFGVVVERGVVRTYARTSNVPNDSDNRDQNTTIKQTIFGNKL